MKKAVVLFALAWALLAGQDRAKSATLTLHTNADAWQGGSTGPVPLCTPQCPVMGNR